LKARTPFWGIAPLPLVLPGLAMAPAPNRDVLTELLLCFTKAGAFVFSCGLAFVPFLNQGVVFTVSV
jgi:hypothetical protein